MSTPLVNSESPVRFVFKRGGGAIIWSRVDVWSEVGTDNEKRVAVLFFDDSLDEIETISRSLAPATYSCVFKAFIREDLNGTYDYAHEVGGQAVFADNGDVNTGATPGEAQGFRDEYVLVVA